MIIVWSFVSVFLLNGIINAETKQDFLFSGTFLMLTLYMWIYNVVGVIKSDFPTQIKINVQPPSKRRKHLFDSPYLQHRKLQRALLNAKAKSQPHKHLQFRQLQE